MHDELKIEMIPVSNLKHIESFSPKRVNWLKFVCHSNSI